MISHRSRKFKKSYALLPAHAQALAIKNYRLWREDPWHPSLQFKDIGSSLWSVRIGIDYRAVGIRDGDVIVWQWIGPHAVYNRLIKQ